MLQRAELYFTCGGLGCKHERGLAVMQALPWNSSRYFACRAAPRRTPCLSRPA